jgi:hypothetical protein
MVGWVESAKTHLKSRSIQLGLEDSPRDYIKKLGDLKVPIRFYGGVIEMPSARLCKRRCRSRSIE